MSKIKLCWTNFEYWILILKKMDKPIIKEHEKSKAIGSEELNVGNEILIKNSQITDANIDTDTNTLTTKLRLNTTTNSTVSNQVAISKIKENFIKIDEYSYGLNNVANNLTDNVNLFASIRRKLIRTFNSKIPTSLSHFATYNLTQVQPMFNMEVIFNNSQFTSPNQRIIAKASIVDQPLSNEYINSNAIVQSKFLNNCLQSSNICKYESNTTTMTKFTSNTDKTFNDEFYLNSVINSDDNWHYLTVYLKVLNQIIQSHCKNCFYFSAYICTKEMTNFHSKLSSPYRIFYFK